MTLGFTLLYFVLVEAMAEDLRGAAFRSHRAQPGLRSCGSSAGSSVRGHRLLIGLANVLLPGKGLRAGPFVSEEDIRAMAQVGSDEG